MTGAKMLYCTWLTAAAETDPFVCAPIRPLPDDLPQDVAREFIRSKEQSTVNRFSDFIRKSAFIFPLPSSKYIVH